MASSYWWFICFFNEHDIQILEPRFKEARQKAILSKESGEIIMRWKNNPNCIVYENTDSLSSSKPSNASLFNWAFRVSGYTEFGTELVADKYPFRVNEDTVFQFVIQRHCTPASVLYYALGPERAEKLPGFMGNMLIKPSEVRTTLLNIQSIFDRANWEHFSLNAKEFLLKAGDYNKETVDRILTAIPKALKKAGDKGCGMFSLGMPQV